MSNFARRKAGKKKKQTRNRDSSKRRNKSKLTISIPNSLSDESSLNDNYLEDYSTESDFSDSKQPQPDEFSSDDEIVEVSENCHQVPLFSVDEEEFSGGPETSQERLNAYFAKLRKSDRNHSFPKSDGIFKPTANGDFSWPGFLKRHFSSDQSQQTAGQASTSSGHVRPPDPKSVPEAVLRLHSMKDVFKNRKVIEYLNQLEAAEHDINMRLEANEKVQAEEIEALHAARDAILKQYGYDFRDKAEMKRDEEKARRHEIRKKEFPSGVSVSSSSESEGTERPLKEEITRRVLRAGPDSNTELSFTDLMKHSPQWVACAAEELVNNDYKGKLENMAKLTGKCRTEKST